MTVIPSSGTARRFGRARELLVLLLLALLGACTRSDDEGRGQQSVVEPPPPTAFGEYHALIIGINDYPYWPTLRFAEGDAADLAQILVAEYNFSPDNITQISGPDATRREVLSHLRRKLENLSEADNLLVFYAGHGQLDPLTESGFWIPYDGELTDESSWIRFTTITEYATAANVQAKSILIVTDSCYGGAIARSGPTPGHTDPDDGIDRYMATLNDLAGKRSRQVVASGGYEQVPDRSHFAELLKNALRSNSYDMIDVEYLFYTEVYPELRRIGQQEPMMARIVTGPYEDGQFVFVRRGATPGPHGDEDEPHAELGRLTVRSNVTADEVYINDEFAGTTRLDLELPAGPYELRVQKDGYLPFEQQVDVEPGGQQTIFADLRPEQQPPARILEFAASPLTMTRGQSATLHWRTEDAVKAEISTLGAVALSGTASIAPGSTTTYTLTVENADGETNSSNATVVVNTPVAQIELFDANPLKLLRGETTTLVWKVTEAAGVEISGVGKVALSGKQRIRPAETATYTLTVTSLGGETVTSELQVYVVEPEPLIRSFVAEPARISSGGKTVLSWSVENATSVQIDGVKTRDPLDTKGSTSVSPTRSTTYTLIASNASGRSTKKSVQVGVSSVPQAPTFQPLTLSTTAAVLTPVLRPHAQGRLTVNQTWRADLDAGSVGSSRDSDIWFEALTATRRYVSPMRGVTQALVGSSAPGRAGCAKANLSTQKISVTSLRVGSYLCVRTNAGRYSQLKVVEAVGPSPGVLKVDYVTWD